MVVELVAADLDRVHERIAGRFGRAEPRARVRECLCGLVAGLERKNGWTLTEHADEAAPDGWRGLNMTADGLRLLQDLRRSLLDPPRQLRPHSVTATGDDDRPENAAAIA